MTNYCSIQDVKDCFVAALPTEFTDPKITDLITKYSLYIDNHLGQVSDTQDVEEACALLVAARIALAIYPENDELRANFKKQADQMLMARKDIIKKDIF